MGLVAPQRVGLPGPGIEPVLPALAGSFNHWTTRKPSNSFSIMQSQIKRSHFTVLVSYSDKEGIWQAGNSPVMISIMMLWTIKFPTEVYEV